MNKNDLNQTPSITKEEPIPKTTPEPHKTHCSCHCGWWWSLTLIIMAGFSAYIFIQLNQINATHRRLTTDLQTTINTLTNEQQTLKDQLQSTTNQIETTQTQLQAQLKAVRNQLKITQDFEQDQAQPWQLRKAEYYLELAAINAHWSHHNQATSVALLQEVEQILQAIPDPRLEPLKKNIAADLVMIQAAPTLDMTMMINTLDEAQTIIETLPFDEASSNVPTIIKQDKNWQNQLQDSLNILKQIVIVHRDNVHTAPLLSPFYQTIIREKIAIDLQQAEWALLQNNADLYGQSLNRVIETIHQNFAHNAAATQAFLEKITGLQQKSIESKTPNFNRSLSLLNELIHDDTSFKIPAVKQPGSH